MQTVRTIAELRRLLVDRRTRQNTVGLVPTMGALHEGHLALLAGARDECDVVVMSLFVNPTQFTAGEDLATYPRDEATDAELASGAGVDLLFAPTTGEMYPPGFSTSVVVRGVSERLEGASRGPSHFDGVTTVVTKLLNIVEPDVAYFGRKDAQQALVIRRLVSDLDIPVRIVVLPTVRDEHGLARSSRNAHLTAGEREQALGLSRALGQAAALIAAGERDSARAVAAAWHELAAYELQPEYLEIVDPETLEAVGTVDRPVLVAVAAKVGQTRLIDNVIASPTSSQED
jgi:pantoate--beta-alanine ligase